MLKLLPKSPFTMAALVGFPFVVKSYVEFVIIIIPRGYGNNTLDHAD